MSFTYDPSLPGISVFEMGWRHFKTALMVSFALFIAALLFMGETHFRLTARVVCPPGAQLIYEEMTDSEGDTSLSGYCQAPGEQPQEKTLEFLLAIYGLYTLAAFAALFSAGTIIRVIRNHQKRESKL